MEKKKRTKLKDRTLPDYTRGEEIFNMVSHIVGGVLAIAALVLCVIFSALFIKPTMELLGSGGMVYLVGGGIAYTIGAVLYGLGKTKRYMHSIFHLFVIAGSVLHFFMILFYVIMR